MWIADEWKDYEVLDCSGGEKIERWGDYILVRPDPQVIWNTPKDQNLWRRKNGHYHRSKKGGGEWEFFNLPEQWSIHYKSLTFHLKPFSFKHTGLFPEQAVNWDWFGAKIRQAGNSTAIITSSNCRMSEQITEMDRTVENIREQSGEVARGMEQVNTNTQNNYGAIEHVVAATQENSAGVEEIEKMVERIKDLAHRAVES